jgi:hypothetical protein
MNDKHELNPHKPNRIEVTYNIGHVVIPKSFFHWKERCMGVSRDISMYLPNDITVLQLQEAVGL